MLFLHMFPVLAQDIGYLHIMGTLVDSGYGINRLNIFDRGNIISRNK